ncbi:hypothetical protein DEFDS_P024 (plasmid) [Deferribacter desulfuricans SSM1]|uniref:Uncharacterized protein n=1 Tax=Deferribacter desulfuricans (strain DSM 14783 / JCM 11476 / NBRC 101012 / SSM1) TaxID=639282 RepID=D3PEL0_DEFDS|nr:hypothetical protein [Deferribacter desulfuricans]BAI81652.1 hypothetical protein DEFDS_P024 [Deferribacter desulfuricans SSM1]
MVGNGKTKKYINSFNVIEEVKIAKTNAIMSVLTKFAIGKSLTNAPELQVVFALGHRMETNNNERRYKWIDSAYFFRDRKEIYDILNGLKKAYKQIEAANQPTPKDVKPIVEYNNPAKKKRLSIYPNIYVDNRTNTPVKNVSIRYSVASENGDKPQFAGISLNMNELKCIIDTIQSTYDNIPLIKTQILATPQYQQMLERKLQANQYQNQQTEFNNNSTTEHSNSVIDDEKLDFNEEVSEINAIDESEFDFNTDTTSSATSAEPELINTNLQFDNSEFDPEPEF